MISSYVVSLEIYVTGKDKGVHILIAIALHQEFNYFTM